MVLVAVRRRVVPVVCDADGDRPFVAVVGTVPYTRMIVNVSKSKKEQKIVKKNIPGPLFLWWRFVIVRCCSLVVVEHSPRKYS